MAGPWNSAWWARGVELGVGGKLSYLMVKDARPAELGNAPPSV